MKSRILDNQKVAPRLDAGRREGLELPGPTDRINRGLVVFAALAFSATVIGIAFLAAWALAAFARSL